MGMAEYSAQRTIEYLASEFRKENLRPVSEQQARFLAQLVYCSLESIAPEYVDQNSQKDLSLRTGLGVDLDLDSLDLVSLCTSLEGEYNAGNTQVHCTYATKIGDMLAHLYDVVYGQQKDRMLEETTGKLENIKFA